MLTTSKGITIGRYYAPPQINNMSLEEQRLQRALLPDPLAEIPKHRDLYRIGAAVILFILFYISVYPR
jgi:hypothetical protein